MNRQLGLGIDTGGTFTDAAIYDRASEAVLWEAKAPTTHDDYAIGIERALDKLPADALRELTMVSLSTTLATNACVEGKGGRAALLLMGYDRRLVDRLCAEYGLDSRALTVIEGRHSQRGEPEQEPDWDAARRWARQRAADCDAIGVVEYWGVRNPAYEQQAMDILRESGLPCAAAHQLTGEINSLKRAATTLLNLRLIPLMAQLMRAVRRTLAERSITAPVWIVRGDGALMSQQGAMDYPVEMLLSGPAASAQGGGYLGGERDCIVVDVGGTTTDIAVLREGRVALEESGAVVGEWRTGTRAAQVRTAGLGGDTRVTLGKQEDIVLDVRRALPLCRLAADFPEIKRELETLIARDARRGYSQGEFLYLARRGIVPLDEQERRVLAALEQGPLSVDELAAQAGTRAYFLRTERLEAEGAVLRCALTLTDLWHARGTLSLFDAEASRLGVALLARRLELDPEELIERALSLADRRMYGLLIGHLMDRAYPAAQLGDAQDIAFGAADGEIAIRFSTPLALVGIGAPAHLVLPEAARRLGARLTLPDHAAVGGAVGAITGLVAAEAEAVVRPLYEAWGVEGYASHAPDETARFEELEQATAHAQAAAIRVARARAQALGAADANVEVQWSESSGKAAGKESASFLLEARVVARAAGKAGY